MTSQRNKNFAFQSALRRMGNSPLVSFSPAQVRRGTEEGLASRHGHQSDYLDGRASQGRPSPSTNRPR